MVVVVLPTPPFWLAMAMIAVPFALSVAFDAEALFVASDSTELRNDEKCGSGVGSACLAPDFQMPVVLSRGDLVVNIATLQCEQDSVFCQKSRCQG